jgi:hypothetical protein
MNTKSPTRINSRRSSRLPLLMAVAWAITALPVLNLCAQLPPGTLFSDDFESAASVSPYTLAQQTANNTLATDSDPNPAQVGSWFTYGGEADGGPGLFGIQVTSVIDTNSPYGAYTGTYPGTNVLRVWRSPVGSGSATCANFTQTQIGGIVRVTWFGMVHNSAAGHASVMIHLSGTVNPGSEGFDTARTSLLIDPDGSTWRYVNLSGFQQISGLTAVINKWQTNTLDIDLDAATFNWTIDGQSSGPIALNGNAPGNSLRSVTFRGGSSANDLLYIDSVLAYSISRPIGAGHTPTDGLRVDSGVPVIYTLTDGFTASQTLVVNTNSIQLSINGSPVTPDSITKVNDTTTIRYIPAGGWTPETTNTVRLVFSDTNAPPGFSTNQFSFIVLPALADNPPRQQDSSPEALLVLEAEHYDRKVASFETGLFFAMDWTPVGSPDGFSGEGGMQALPGENPNANLGSTVDNAPRMDYKVRFNRTGTHYIWVRGYAPSLTGGFGAHDSVFAGIDGNPVLTVISGFQDTTANPAWTWSTATVTVTPPVGYHYVTLWMRENGVAVDKIVITSNPNFVPTGVGPAESPIGPSSSYWPFEEGSGVALDIDEDHPFNGTLLGTASRSNSVFAAVVPRTSAANTRSVNFTGTDGNAVDMGGGTNVDIGSGDFTLQGWINARAIPGGVAFIAGKHITSLFANKGYALVANPSGAGFTVSGSISGGGTVVTATSGVLNLSQWYHLALVRSAGTLKLYVDGVQAQSVTDSIPGTSLNSTQNFSVGGAREGDGNFHNPFNGLIDEVRITGTALAPNQFLNAPLPIRPTIASRFPAPGATGVSGSTNIVITLQDGTIHVLTNTIQLALNNVTVTPTITQTNGTNTIIAYDPPGNMTGGSVNTVRLIFTDDGSPALTVTNTFSFTIAYVPISVPSYWRFEEASGPTALDSSGPFPGTLSGNAVRDADVPVATIPQTGAANTKSMLFDGVGAAGTVGTAVDMGPSVQVISNDFTLECYVKVTGTPNNPAIVVGKLQTGLFSDRFFSINTSPQVGGTINFAFAMTGGNGISTGLKNMNQWYHVAGVRQGTAIRIYVDGALENSGTLNNFQDFTSDQRFCVAGGASGGVNNMQGLVDEVRLSPSGLPPALFLNAPPAAILNFSRSGNQLTLSWTASGFVLQENSSVTNAAGWSNVSGGNTSPVIINMNAAPKFYRLIK